MSKKRTEKIIDVILQKVSEKIGEVYTVDPEEILNHIHDIPESLNYTHIFTKGKRKGRICNATLCPHHESDIKSNDDGGVVLEFGESKEAVFIPYEISDSENTFGDNDAVDANMAIAIEESIMYTNVNSTRDDMGIHPLKPYTEIEN